MRDMKTARRWAKNSQTRISWFLRRGMGIWLHLWDRTKCIWLLIAWWQSCV